MRYLILCSALLLSACSATNDLQGHDPNVYYAAHPKVNKVETRSLTQDVSFMRGSNKLEDSQKRELYQALRSVSPEAADSVLVEFSPAQLRNTQRRASIQRSLRSFGYTSVKPVFEPSQALGDDEARVTLSYAAVVSPDCPDWKLSPVTTYSNTSQGNLGCATVVNLGLQVADPHDLVRGQGDGWMSTQRNMDVVRDFRNGKNFSPTAQGASAGGVESAASASPSSTTGQ